VPRKMPQRVKGKRGRKRKSTVVEADEPDTEAEAEPEVAHPAKKMMTDKRKRGRKRQSAIRDAGQRLNQIQT
jgi:hypothetical protein